MGATDVMLVPKNYIIPGGGVGVGVCGRGVEGGNQIPTFLFPLPNNFLPSNNLKLLPRQQC